MILALIVASFITYWCYIHFYKPKTDIVPSGKSVLITGAASGIGKATVERFAKQGCFVFATDVRLPLLEKSYAESPYLNVCLELVEMDVSKKESIQLAFEKISKSQNSKDLFAIVNCAGISGNLANQPPMTILETEDDIIKSVLDINLLGSIRVNSMFHNFIRQNKGVYIQISSILGIIGQPCVAPYAASKHGIEGYCKALRLEMRKYGVRVVAIEPGWIKTPMVEQGVLERDFASGREKLQYPDAFPFDRVEFIRNSLKRELTEPSVVADEIFRCAFTSNLPTNHVVVAPVLSKILYLFLSSIPVRAHDKIMSC